jgi:hypothetical protein
MALTSSCVPLLPTYTTRRPSGVTAKSRPVSVIVGAAFPGVGIATRETRGGAGDVSSHPPAPVRALAMMAAAA